MGVDAGARAVVATNSAVYVGGSYTSAGGTPRANAAAFAGSNGALLPWNPNADFLVSALAASSDGQSVFLGGSFQNVGGQPAYGLAKVTAGSGEIDTTWRAAETVRNAGADAGITSLSVQNGFLYGTTYHFGPGGNLEGTFKAPVGTGVVEWVTDCHGDMYSSYVNSGVVYIAGHSHYCGNMGGGFPQYPTWKYQHAMAVTDAVGGDILNEVHGYYNWQGRVEGALAGQLVARHGHRQVRPGSTRPAGACPATTTTSPTAASSPASTGPASRAWCASRRSRPRRPSRARAS